jgi:hypothetical protein
VKAQYLHLKDARFAGPQYRIVSFAPWDALDLALFWRQIPVGAIYTVCVALRRKMGWAVRPLRADAIELLQVQDGHIECVALSA